MHRSRLPLLALLVLLAAGWLALLITSPLLGLDFYPLHFAARRVLAGLSPYGLAATAELVRQWPQPFADAGIAYPLPFIVAVLPLALVPFPLAAVLWTLAGAMAALAALRLAPDGRLVALPLLFLPFHRSVALGQATLVWFGLAALLVLGVQARRGWLVGLLAVLLLLKPQNGLLFALAGLVWLIREDRRGLLGFVGTGAALGAIALVVEPNWLGDWLAQTARYRAIVQPPSLLPWGMLLIVACWRQPWWVSVAAAQVVLFPLSDVYSALPLLLCWIGVGGPLALAGAGVSWLWSIGGLPNTLGVFWMLMITPLVGALLWRAAGSRLRRRTARAAA